MRNILTGDISEQKKALSSEIFFQELINGYAEAKVLSDKEIEKIFYERIELLKEKLKYYTRNESSSIAEEEAESILNGIDYTIGIYLKSLVGERIISELRNEDLGEILKKGEKLIKDKVAQNKIFYEKIKANKLNVNNYSYDDTVEYGLSVFFPKYDMFFKPQDTPCSIDYQLPIDIMNYKGIEYIEKYLKILNLEGKFCNKFGSNQIKTLLKSYDNKYEELLVNIFKLVLMNALGRLMCNKTLDDLTLNKNDMLQIQHDYKDLSQEEVILKFIEMLKKSLQVLNIKDEELFTYGSILIEQDYEYIYKNIKSFTLDKVFIISTEREGSEIIKYVDGRKISNSKFREYTEKIRQCISIEEKVNIINNSFKSLEDIVDMLESECLFDDEYYIYFKSMTEIHLILLYKYMFEKYFEDECDIEWCCHLKKYILSLSKEKQKNIKDISGKIEFTL